ncbi:hypothetical protein JDV02_009914 [Purpureocillium takamizusanense]|uniref:Uncharacterized protein n=1 Tax=Purpureocillium takamizusanense TaxID=2060973 RepID=A0A9Q8VG42_9HYPO|nr:uncharacterized protein JDV02_009914 [Purpureocillium takamizusanense]UNI24141.1 hypothetical protein JDV02_009914 [Purpureocillium takamizusanense]
MDATYRDLVLNVPPPSGNNNNLYDQSGLDSLVTVMRAMYASRLGVCDSPLGDAEGAQRNPIIKYSLRSFAGARKEAQEIEAKDLALIDMDKPEINKPTPPPTFFNLATSRLMNETFWAREEHILFTAMMRPSWDAPFMTRLAPTRPELRAKAASDSLLLFDRGAKDRGKTLNQFMAEHFTADEDPDTGAVTLRKCNEPGFIRILYQGNTNEPLELDALRSIQVPVGQLVQTGDGKGTAYDPCHHRRVYHLLAVVRLRRSTTGCDWVQVFVPPSITPVKPVVPSPYINRDDLWSMDHATGQYGGFMLFYRCSPKDVELPSQVDHKVPQEQSDEAIQRLVNILDK